jgi:2-polyprenyl-6-methoxyphenol hydroxylase-like FAD-dependent oxidoreductase
MMASSTLQSFRRFCRFESGSGSVLGFVGSRQRRVSRHRRVRWVTAAADPAAAAPSTDPDPEPAPYPVVIIGGGPSGLLMSNFLSLYQVPSILLEAQSVESRFRHPQAHFLNTRTMEILQHWMPETYNQVCKAMPPVEHWKTFRFTHDMSAEPLAQVVHPVDRPLQAEVDANGVLDLDLVLQSTSQSDETAQLEDRTRALSPCRVGHLAQHTFCQILYDSAVKNAVHVDGRSTQLLYDTSVSRVGRRSRPRRGTDPSRPNQTQSNSNQLVVETANGQSFYASVCIAADGANSMIRQSEHIGMRGQEGLQHLINIHVTLPHEQALKLHHDKNHAMLYFVLNEAAVSTVVCHSVGEYIIQIPYFPPYQSLEQDFGPDRLPAILQTIFGPTVSDWKVQSVKSWTMSSLVADQFYSSGDIAFVGDAAHVFPPAGGFGMNTGLQDVHNLAWKLAWVIHNNRLDTHLKAVLQSYGNERRPVAQQNAALSVRNYHRLLQVTKSCYLNEQHPTILRRVLDVSPLAFGAKRTIFQSLLQTALHPLSWLQQPRSMYSKHIQSSLRRVLRTGTGLPLLFPRFEIGFGYPSLSSSTSTKDQHKIPNETADNDWRQDTVMDLPTIKVGYLLPHVEVQVVSKAEDHPNLQYVSTNTISTSDLPAQVARENLPTFVLLCVGSLENQLVQQICRAVSTEIGLPVVSVQLKEADKYMYGVSEGPVLSLSSDTPAFHCPSEQGGAYAVLIRPDGHIAGIAAELVSKEAVEQQLCEEALASLLFYIDTS